MFYINNIDNMKTIILSLLIIYLFWYISIKNKEIKKEGFIDSNFNMCKENDCECLKLKTAPDGKCVNYDIANPPLIPEYENKKIFKSHVVRNNEYPLKKNDTILIFVGFKMRNKKKNFENLPHMIRMIERVEHGRYSEDKNSHYVYEVFENASKLLSRLDGDKPYLKWLILDTNNLGIDLELMKSYKIDREKFPAIYMYKETTNKLTEFKFNIRDDRCLILQDLLLFIANGDCGLVSYLNHLEDPFLGMKFYHDSKNNTWEPHPRRGVHLYNNGTNMCKLIDYQDLPKSFKCQKK